MTYTKEQIKEKITTNQKWTERAVVALFNKQTASEQSVEVTHVSNGAGFNKPDSHKLTYYAKWVLSGKHLTGKFLEDAQKRIAKYASQLYGIAKTNN